MKLLQSTLLETFVAVVECGGFTEAQYRLGISQSAISLRIRDLEVLLGYRLCARGRGGFRMTERGEIAFRKAREGLRKARDFDADMLALKGGLTGDLRIGTVDAIRSLPGLDLAALIGRFLQRPNEIRLEMTQGSPVELTQQLLSGTLHLALAPFRNQLPELQYQEICREEHRLYCGVGHPLYDRAAAEVDPQELSRFPLCCRTYEPALFSQDTLQAGTAQAVNAQLMNGQGEGAQVDNMEAMALLIESGRFLGTLPTHFAQAGLRSGRIQELKHSSLRWYSTFFLALRPQQLQRDVVARFVEDLGADPRGTTRGTARPRSP